MHLYFYWMFNVKSISRSIILALIIWILWLYFYMYELNFLRTLRWIDFNELNSTKWILLNDFRWIDFYGLHSTKWIPWSSSKWWGTALIISTGQVVTTRQYYIEFDSLLFPLLYIFQSYSFFIILVIKKRRIHCSTMSCFHHRRVILCLFTIKIKASFTFSAIQPMLHKVKSSRQNSFVSKSDCV